MLVVHVHAHVRAGRVADFLAATRVNAQASLGEFPADGAGWASNNP